MKEIFSAACLMAIIYVITLAFFGIAALEGDFDRIARAPIILLEILLR